VRDACSERRDGRSLDVRFFLGGAKPLANGARALAIANEVDELVDLSFELVEPRLVRADLGIVSSRDLAKGLRDSLSGVRDPFRCRDATS
jgi:hypothetical protein